MIKQSRQDWTVGATVKVGFLQLEVVGMIPTPGDYRPDQYMLVGKTGKRYVFTPHYGLRSATWEDEAQLIAARG